MLLGSYLSGIGYDCHIDNSAEKCDNCRKELSVSIAAKPILGGQSGGVAVRGEGKVEGQCGGGAVRGVGEGGGIEGRVKLNH